MLILLCIFFPFFLNAQQITVPAIKFIDCYFENASSLNWEAQGDTLIKIFLMADYEKGTPNRQTDHWYFRLEADKGTHIKLVISKLMADIYNDRLATRWWDFNHDISCYISYNRKTWEAISTSKLPENELLVDFVMKNRSVYVARLPVYIQKDLELFEDRIGLHPNVKIIPIGITVESRPLEIIRVGDPDAKFSILLRARAHPWEPGGNWVLEGLIDKFLESNAGNETWKQQICYYIMPMANKDGVFRGMTRFNVNGKDLNRNWLDDIDPIDAPENYALEKFLANLIREGHKPALMVDFHNDDAGDLQASKPKDGDGEYMRKMQIFHSLLTEKTWFSNKLVPKIAFSGGGTIVDGMYYKFGIDAVTFELNANYIEKLNKIPETTDWKELGAKLNEVFSQYLINYQHVK